MSAASLPCVMDARGGRGRLRLRLFARKGETAVLLLDEPRGPADPEIDREIGVLAWMVLATAHLQFGARPDVIRVFHRIGRPGAGLATYRVEFGGFSHAEGFSLPLWLPIDPAELAGLVDRVADQADTDEACEGA